MDVTGGEFLASAGFAGNVNRGLAAGQFGDCGTQFFHGGGVPQQTWRLAGVGGRFGNML